MAAGILKNLEGIKKKETEASFFRAYWDILPILIKGEAATAAGKKGAIDVYEDDRGRIRCNLHENYQTVEHKVFDDLTSAKDWINTNITKIEIQTEE